MSYTISVDHGNSQIKTPKYVFESGISEHAVMPPITDEYIKFNNMYYTLSTSRAIYTRDKTSDNTFFILTLFAIVKELPQNCDAKNTEINLACGLPPEHFGALKDKYTDFFLNKCKKTSFEYNAKEYNICIKSVSIFPQGFAAIVPYIREVQQHNKLFIVDVGGYTVDVLMLRKGKPDLQFCRSLELGIITLCNNIKGKYNALYDVLLEDDNITEIINNKPSTVAAELQKNIRATAKHHATQIINKLRELSIDLKSNPVYFIGGGSLLLKTYFNELNLISSAKYIDDVKANAKGYFELAQHQLKSK